jgi:hypothetical protein
MMLNSATNVIIIINNSCRVFSFIQTNDKRQSTFDRCSTFIIRNHHLTISFLMKKTIITCIIGLSAALVQAQTVSPQRSSLNTKDVKDKINIPTTPKWAHDAVIYEVNLRQFTPSGTLNEFTPQLDRLKDMGVKILWFMPIQPIGVKNRKGSLGSYYAVRDYMALNPEYGSMEDWIKMVNKAHQLGMKVIIDWVSLPR